ncbi:lytic transglycosylase domain-containing protein [Rhizobium terrae]|uniref:lytic transglycosylase domain-containing protein n=1 Tax=Rhizobium terrae TaxID=2171756 RepID=UPI001D0303AD|nr:lytic transglycosylase domain-containing protein [Rhizobium terrae]
MRQSQHFSSILEQALLACMACFATPSEHIDFEYKFHNLYVKSKNYYENLKFQYRTNTPLASKDLASFTKEPPALGSAREDAHNSGYKGETSWYFFSNSLSRHHLPSLVLAGPHGYTKNMTLLKNRSASVSIDPKPAWKAQECGPSPLAPTEIRRLVQQSARRHQVDEALAMAIAWAESGFDRRRNSPKGARGPMQLMPETALRFGVTDICDPEDNIEGGMKYLRVLFDEFQNPLFVAAAYNSGEQRVRQYSGIPPFAETLGYVAKVVNHQLGLPMPSLKRSATRRSGRAAAATNRDDATGVIPVEKTGRFIGGVMHF